jgi:hypothetical protein
VNSKQACQPGNFIPHSPSVCNPNECGCHRRTFFAITPCMLADFFLNSTLSGVFAKFFPDTFTVALARRIRAITMSFSSLVQDLSFRDANDERRPARGPLSTSSTIDDRRSHVSRAMSYASTSATSVSISGDISSQLHGGYSHPLARSWQAERQLTKVSTRPFTHPMPPSIANTKPL